VQTYGGGFESLPQKKRLPSKFFFIYICNDYNVLSSSELAGKSYGKFMAKFTQNI
jgi:predicted solute-binding protein